MRDDGNYVYRIWDVDNNQYWHSPNGQRQWTTATAAARTWNNARCWVRDAEGNRMKWSDYEDTSRGFIMHKFRLQRVK